MISNQKATPNCSNRLLEWASAIMIAQMGLVILFSEWIMHAKPQAAFSALTNTGMSPTDVGLLFVLVGGARCVALNRNGKWKNGPRVRACGAAVSMLIWGQLLYGIVHYFVTTGEIYLSLGIWDTLFVFEYLNFKRALLDMKKLPPAVQVAEHVR